MVTRNGLTSFAGKTCLVLLLLSWRGLCYSDVWKGPFEYNKFDGIFPVGKTKTDEPIYLGLAVKSEKKISLFDLVREKNTTLEKIRLPAGSEWVLAKVSKPYKGAFYLDGDQESHATSFMLFMPENPEAFSWVKASDGAIPPGAVSLPDPKSYICRAEWVEGFVPGTLVEGGKVCKVGFAGGVIKSYVYEVLVKAG